MWVFYALYSALSAAIFTGATKQLLKSIHPIAFSVYSSLMLLPIMLVILAIQGFPKTGPEFFQTIFMAAVLDAFAFVTTYYAFQRSAISLLAPISSFQPVFATLFAIYTLHEVPTAQKLIGIALIVFGAYLLNVKDIHQGFFKPITRLFADKGVLLFFLANILFGLTPSFQKQAIFATSPQTPLYASFFDAMFVTMLLLPFLFIKGKKSDVTKPGNFALLALLALNGTFAQWAAYNAFAQTNVGYASAVFKLSTLFTILFCGLFFKEDRLSERLLGAVVMVGGTLLLAF